MLNVCDDCALRLYNTKAHNISGVGNPFYGNCIVVPNVDYAAYKGKSMDFSTQVKEIENTLNLPTGVGESNLFVVPLIRCNEQISCKVDNITYNKCLHWFTEDMRKYRFKNVMLLGNAARRFLNINIKEYLNTVFISKNNVRYFVNYSPLIKYNDEKLYEEFKRCLLRWYCCIDVDYRNYEWYKL